MENKNQPQSYAYFAAANGYSGFRSYFKSIFDPQSFTRIFILKGGPGTGKNTIMRQMHQRFYKDCIDSELILCSSDISSLDGVILKSEKGRIAVIDGTAPHTTDPIYPGCIDEIINLGEHWDQNLLANSRNTIEALTTEKKQAYNRAYSFLNLAGKCDEEINEVIVNAYVDNKKNNLHTDSIQGCRLIDAFGKDGVCEIDTLRLIADKIIAIYGIYGSDQLYINELTRMYSNDDIVVFNSVFSSSKIKAVYIKSENTAYIAHPTESIKTDLSIDVSYLLDDSIIKASTEYLEKVAGIKELLLWHSTDEFKKASLAHFKLEDIYKSAMNFSSLDSVKENLIEKINNILF